MSDFISEKEDIQMSDNVEVVADEVEMIITSEDMVEVEDSESAAYSGRGCRTVGEIYDEYRSRSPKKKRKKKKRHKCEKEYENLLCVPLNDALLQLKRDRFQEGVTVRTGNRIPPSMILHPYNNPGFLFGKTVSNHYVGKPQDKDGHIAVIGGSGSGKTTGIAIPTTYTWKGTIFSFDFKGDIINRAAKRPTKILYMIKGQVNRFWYDPYYILRRDGEENLVQNACELAQAIIPLPYNVSDPFWIESARNVLTGAIIYYFKLGKDFIDSMIEIKTTSMTELLKKIMTDKQAAVNVSQDLVLNPKTLSGVSVELHNHIRVFVADTLIRNVLSSSEDIPKEPFSWEDLERISIFIRIDQSRIEQWQPVIRLMVVQLMRTLERRPEKYELGGMKVKPTLLMLDEFPQYGKIDVFVSSFRTLRSKNVTVSIFCQSLADLDEIYGEAARRVILDNCSYKAILGANDAETQRFFSDLVGTVKVPSEGVSVNFDEMGQHIGHSVSINESQEPIIFPHEFSSLSDVILLHPEAGGFCRVEKETRFRNAVDQKLIEGGN